MRYLLRVFCIFFFFFFFCILITYHFCLCAGGGNLGGISQAIRGTAQLMEQGVGTMSKFQGMMG
jgi:hypothetical protein